MRSSRSRSVIAQPQKKPARGGHKVQGGETACNRHASGETRIPSLARTLLGRVSSLIFSRFRVDIRAQLMPRHACRPLHLQHPLDRNPAPATDSLRCNLQDSCQGRRAAGNVYSPCEGALSGYRFHAAIVITVYSDNQQENIFNCLLQRLSTCGYNAGIDKTQQREKQ